MTQNSFTTFNPSVLNFTHISQLNKSVTVSKKQLISAFLQLNSPNVGIIEDNMKALETVSRNMCCGLCSHEAILFCLSFMIEISYPACLTVKQLQVKSVKEPWFAVILLALLACCLMKEIKRLLLKHVLYVTCVASKRLCKANQSSNRLTL